MNIKVLEKTKGCMPEIIKEGDWIDLKTARKIELKAPAVEGEGFSTALIPLGIAMKLPKGYEAHVLPRSSTFKKYGIIMTNSQGIIDNSYCGNDDEWKFPAMAFKEIVIPKGTRIAQFRIVLSQKATIWQKIKHMFSSHIKLQKVESLSWNNRGGFGSTGDTAYTTKAGTKTKGKKGTPQGKKNK